MDKKGKRDFKEQGSVKLYRNVEMVCQDKGNLKMVCCITELLLIFLSAFGTIFTFATAFERKIPEQLTIISILIFTVIIWALLQKKEMKRAVVIGLLVFGAYLFLLFTEEIKMGFIQVVNSVIENINYYYEIKLSLLPGGYKGVTSPNVFWVFFAYLTVWIVSYVICTGKKRILYLVFTVSIVAIPFAVGLIPKGQYLIPYAIAAIAVMGNGFWVHGEIKAQIKLLIVTLAASLSLILYVSFPPSVYEKSVNVEKLKHSIQEKGIDFINSHNVRSLIGGKLILFPTKAKGGLSNGSLGQVGEISFSGETALELTAPKELNLQFYLKSFVGTEYAMNYWKPLKKEERKDYNKLTKQYGENTESYPGQWESIGENRKSTSITITNIDAGGDNLFLPYGIKNIVTVDKNGKVRAKNLKKEKRSYQVESYFDIDTIIRDVVQYNRNIPIREVTFEDVEYREYVYEVYTRLPETGAILLLEQAQSELMLDPEEPETKVRQSILQVREFLESRADYSLLPGTLPEGKDFVDYFLFENQKGYCAHFATAATLLFRYMGIPARYVEGYIVTNYDFAYPRIVGDNQIISIKDTNAHAWAEIYVDTYGWVPIEVTPGYAGGSRPFEFKNPVDDSSPGALDLVERSMQDTVNPMLDNQNAGNTDNRNTKNSDWIKKAPKALLAAVFLCIVLTVVFLGIWVRRKIWEIKGRRIIRSKNVNRRFLYRYMQLETLFAYAYKWGRKACLEENYEDALERCQNADGLRNFMETARKAAFGSRFIEQEEWERGEAYYEQAKNGIIRSSSVYQRLFCRFLLNI